MTSTTNKQNLDTPKLDKIPTVDVTQILLHRFPMSKDMTELIFEFSKIHEYDDRKTYKEQWQIWTKCQDITSQIDTELTRLQWQGFKGDKSELINKMFISSKYYYRNIKTIEYSAETVPRKEYTKLSAEYLISMDEWLANNQRPHCSPAQLFVLYCNENKAFLQTEIQTLRQMAGSDLDATETEMKFKKTFRNRELILRKKYAKSNNNI